MKGKNGDSTRGSKGGEPTPEGDGAHRPGGETTAPMPRRAFIGEWIGHYRAIEILGEGGFGVVLLAERREPMVQRVAIKVIRPGHDSRDVVARFEQERQLLAMLDHPNIAKVFDAGETDDGRPYFVMELVRGDWITRFADRRGLTREERLKLFLPVCDAMQHAHRRGVIHRDLKPGNILVAEADDGAAMPKVIDFGIAKALAGPMTDKTLATRAGGAMGSPHYMSREQALGTEIDASSDVYGLSAVLYELLTGKRPLEHLNLSEVPDQMLGITIASAVVRRPREVTPDLPDELETILLRGLCPERTRRYADAGGLGDDVRRYLAGEPVLAKRDGVGYVLNTRARSLVAHNLAASVLVAWVLCTLLVCLAIGPLVDQFDGPVRVVQAAFQRLKPFSPPLAGELKDVRVVEFRDLVTSIDIAERARVQGVTEDLKSERRLYAAMMTRAAETGAQVIVIDASFSSDSEHDESLGQAIDFCRRAEVRLILGCSRWPTPLGEPPALSQELARQIDGKPGSPVASWYRLSKLAGDDSWAIPAVIQRASGGPVLHGAVLASAAARKKDCEMEPRFDEAKKMLTLNYWKVDQRRGRVAQREQDRIRLLAVQSVDSLKMENITADPGDSAGVVHVSVAPDAALRPSVRSLESALTMPAAELKDWLSGKTLIIGDARKWRGDVILLDDGRLVPGPEILACVVQNLLDEMKASSGAVQLASDKLMIAITAAATGLGVMVVGMRKKRQIFILIFLCIGVLAVVGAMVGIFLAYGLLAIPIAPVLGLLLGAGAGVWISAAYSRVPRVDGTLIVLAERSSVGVRP